MRPVAEQECLLLLIAERLAELGNQIVLEVERIVIEQLLRYLDRDVELVRIENHLRERCVSEGQRRPLINPRRSGLRRRDVDLVLAARRDRRRKRAQHILLMQHIDQTVVILLRHKISAARVRPLEELIVNPLKLRAEGAEHRLTVRITRPARFFCTDTSIRRVRDWRRRRLQKLRVENCLTLHALDILAECQHLLLHLLIRLCILGRKSAVMRMLLQKSLCVLPESGTLLAHCQNLVHK